MISRTFLILEATQSPALIRTTLLPILDSIVSFDELIIFTSSECGHHVAELIDGKAATIRTFDNYFCNPEVELAALKLCRERRVEQVIALREFDLLRAARIREELGLPDMPRRNIELFRDKLSMKQHAKAYGLHTPRFLPVDNARDLLHAAIELGFPFITKPRRKAGGIGFTVHRSYEDLSELCRALSSSAGIDSSLDLIAEEFYGTRNMFHLDGLWSGQDILYFSANEYIGLKQHHPGFRPDIDLYPVCGSLNLPKCDPLWTPLRQFAIDVLKALGEGSDVPHAFHIEVWEMNGQLSLNEAACRTGGGQAYEMQIELLGTTLDALYLRALQNLPLACDLPEALTYTLMARIPCKPGVLRELPAVQSDAVRRIKLTVEVGDEVPSQTGWLDRMGYSVCVSNARSEVFCAALSVRESIHASIAS